MKPRVFIGSSTEGLDIAERVKLFFSSDFDCYLWTDDVFKYNQSSFETLCKESGLFDFGLMIFTKDDYVECRDCPFVAPRDNVVFEYGLFLGRLGIERAYIIQEQGCKMPTDMLGVSIAQFERTKAGKISTRSFEKKLSVLKTQIEEKMRLGLLGMLPSTALAIGYFYNFVQLVCESLASQDVITVDGKDYRTDKIVFEIVIPNNLDSDIKKKTDIYYKRKSLKHESIQTKYRQYPLYVLVEDASDKLIISDMPTTLEGVDKAIDMYLRKGHIGKSVEQDLLEIRELRNFKHVLNLLIEDDAYCRKYAQIIMEDAES